MRVYHLLAARWALDDLRRKRVKVSLFADLNDPFELLGVELADAGARRTFNKWREEAIGRYGVLCFSKDWKSPLLWSHYADKHQGICLGFDVPDEHLRNVDYVEDRQSVDNLVGEAEGVEPGPLFHLKFKAWEYEGEVRRILRLADCVRDGANLFWPIGPAYGLELKEVITGSRCPIAQNELRTVVGDSNDVVEMTHARPAFKTFTIVTQNLGFPSNSALTRELRAGRVDEIQRGSGEWLFVDLGFSRDAASCGLLHDDGTPEQLTFGAALQRVVGATSRPGGPLNLVIEAPLSVAFTAQGNPTGRSLEKQPNGARYWYAPVGCLVLVAATHLLRAIATAGVQREVRLFEAFVSFKVKGTRSCHTDDVLCLRETVWFPDRFPTAITVPDALRANPSDILSSVLDQHGLGSGIPPVISATTRPMSEPGSA